MAGEDEFHDDNPPPPPPPVLPTQQAPHTLSTIKLPILKKGEYDIWAMKMEHYLGHIDYPIWEVIQKGNGPVQVSTNTNGQIRVLPLKTVEEILARERKARTTLLMYIPEDHLAKFHKITDDKEMWEAIKSRFGGNDESKKMQKYILRQQFKSFSVSNSEGLHKGSDRFQILLSQLKIHGAGVSTEDANQKFLSLTIPGPKVFESDVKGSPLIIIPSTQNGSSSYTDELMYSFFANQSSGPQLDHKDLEHLNEFDLEEIDLKWQVAMISMRLKKFYKKTGRRLQFDAKEPVGFDKTKVECFNCHNTGHFARKCRSKGNQESRRRDAGNTGYRAKDNGRRSGKHKEPKYLVTLDGEGSDIEVKSYSKECVESYAKLKKLYDEEREQLGDASIEIQAYTQALKKAEAQLVVISKKSLVYEKKLVEAVKEKEELKTKLETFQSSSKGLSKLLNSQMSAKDKSGIGYGDQIHEDVLSYENEVLESVFDSRSSDVEDSPVYDRFAKVEGMHAVPPPMTRIYMPPKSDFGIDESNFTYGPKHVETLESVPKPAVNEPKAVSKPKVWSDAPIIEEYESDSDDEYVIKPSKEQEKPSFAFVNTVKHVKTPRETVKEQNTCSPSPKADKRDWNGLMSKKLGLGYGFTKNACFGKGTGQGENRPVWNNVQRLNHQNKFVPKAVLTKTGIFPVNAARQNPSSQAAETSTARKVNTARPIVNEIRQRNNFYKSHSPIRRPFNKSTAPKANFTNPKVNTAGDKTVSDVRGYRETVVKTLVGCNWRSKRHYWNKVSKYNSGSNSSKNVNFKDPLGRPKSAMAWAHDWDKAYLGISDYNRWPCCLFEEVKGIKREYSNARTPQQNGVAERKNRTLIEAARTMLADSFLPNTFWAEAVSTACYVLNRVLVTKPQNKTPYELITGKIPIISYIRPFGCHVTILNTIDHLGKFEEKSDEGFLVGYSLNSKAFRPVTVENKANKTVGPKEANHSAGTQDNINAGNSKMEAEPAQEYFVLPLWSSYTSTVKSSEAKNGDEKPNEDTGPKTNEEPKDQEDQAFLEELERLKRQEKEANDAAEAFRKEFAQCTKDLLLQAGAARATSTNTVNTVSTPISTASPSRVFSTGGPDLTNNDQDDSQIPALEDIYDNPSDGIFTNASYDDEGAVADFTNLETTVNVSPIPTSRIHSIHPTTQILRDPTSAVQTRSKVNKSSGAHAFIEPKKISQALEDKSWVDAMQEELLQFKIQKVWILVDLPFGKKAIGTKWVYRNRRMKEVLIEAIRIFLAFASYMGFIVYQMDVKSAFLYGTTDEEVVDTEEEPLNKYPFSSEGRNDIMLVQMSSMGLLSWITGPAERRWYFISQDKYVVEILKKFNFDSVKTASTPIETQKPLIKDVEAADVDVHLYRSMIGSLMYLTASRPDIMFAFRACSRRLISWQCKKQTIVATSTTEADDVAAANCRGQREYSNARTPQQNGVTERKIRSLIEAARTMLADSFLPNTFWAEAVSTACYVLNRVLVTKPQNKTPYELITGKIPTISYIRPFGCHVTILNTIDHLGKFEEKSNEGFLVGYSLNSKDFRVYNLETKRVEENLHINFLENKPNVAGKGPNWLFDLNYLTDSMNYHPVTTKNKANKTTSPKEANHSAGTPYNIDVGNSEIEAEPAQKYFVLPLWSSYTSTVKSSEAKNGDEKLNGDTGPITNEEAKDQEDQAFLEELKRLKRQEKEANNAAKALRKEFAQCTEDLLLQAGATRATSTNTVNTVSRPISTASPSRVFSAGGPDLTNNDRQTGFLLWRLPRMLRLQRLESRSWKRSGRKNAKSKPTLDAFDDLDADLAHGMDYMEKKEDVNEGRQSNETEELNLDVDTEVIAEDKGSGEKGGSIVSTARPEVDTAKPDIDTARPEVHNANAPVSTVGVTISTVDLEVSVVEPRTPPTTTSIFDDEDITMAQTLIKMQEEKAKEKRVAFKDVEDFSRPVRSITTLKPLPSIDPKDKGNDILVEEEPVKIKRKDQGIDQIERDEELSHKLHEEELAEIARIQEEKAAQEEASREEREEYTIEERAKFLAETIAAQRKFRAAEIRSRPPTKSQLRNLMMTYLKNMGGYKHSQLKAKTFEEIQAMYERQKKKIDDFKPMDSDDAVKDSKKAASEDTSKKKEVLKEPVSTKIESMNKEDTGERVSDVSKKRKGGPRMKIMSKRKKTESDLEEEEDLKSFLKIVPNKEGIKDYEVLEKRFPIINWESKFYHYDIHGAKGIYYRIFRSDGSSRWIKTFSEMVTRFDRLDLVELYNLVMQRFKTITPEGVDLVLWGDLRTMFDANAEDELWQNQERWNLKS
ncbi:ribonuclease H-like domain-containing protein [Tanacetum coccineum]